MAERVLCRIRGQPVCYRAYPAGADGPLATVARLDNRSGERKRGSNAGGTPPSVQLLGTRIDATTYEEATRLVLQWAREGRSRYVCAANVHMVMEAHDDPDFLQVINGADLVTPDGMPLVWALRLLGRRGQPRVYGPTLTLRICEAAAREGVPVGFHGGHPEALPAMLSRLSQQFPGLKVPYAKAPPFGEPTLAQLRDVEGQIARSGAKILFVGLGCPKQEQWMASRARRLPSVMLGVGAAFDFISGRIPQAPPLIQAAGLEWLFRLGADPRRLWRRYLRHNPRFLALIGWQLLRSSRRNGAVH